MLLTSPEELQASTFLNTLHIILMIAYLYPIWIVMALTLTPFFAIAQLIMISPGIFYHMYPGITKLALFRGFSNLITTLTLAIPVVLIILYLYVEERIGEGIITVLTYIALPAAIINIVYLFLLNTVENQEEPRYIIVNSEGMPLNQQMMMQTPNVTESYQAFMSQQKTMV